jgi:hypothetical protein
LKIKNRGFGMLMNLVKDIDGNYAPKDFMGMELPSFTLLNRIGKLDNSETIYKLLYLVGNIKSAAFTKFEPASFGEPSPHSIETLERVEAYLSHFGWSDILSEQNVTCEVIRGCVSDTGEVLEYMIEER